MTAQAYSKLLNDRITELEITSSASQWGQIEIGEVSGMTLEIAKDK
jgi:hypothetical protein